MLKTPSPGKSINNIFCLISSSSNSKNLIYTFNSINESSSFIDLFLLFILSISLSILVLSSQIFLGFSKVKYLLPNFNFISYNSAISLFEVYSMITPLFVHTPLAVGKNCIFLSVFHPSFFGITNYKKNLYFFTFTKIVLLIFHKQLLSKIFKDFKILWLI